MKAMAKKRIRSLADGRNLKYQLLCAKNKKQIIQRKEIRHILDSSAVQSKSMTVQEDEQRGGYNLTTSSDFYLTRQSNNPEKDKTLHTKHPKTPIVQKQSQGSETNQPIDNPSSDSRMSCVEREAIPGDHTGVINPQGIVHDYFTMQADWSGTGPRCNCTCGEYRQYVKGHVIVNNRRVRKRLYKNAYLEEDNYHEDADDSGRIPYGHRTGFQNTRIDMFTDAQGAASNRETACFYRGYDTPGIPVPIGSIVDMHLKFKGQTYDRCRKRFGPIHEWESIWNGPVN